MGLIGEDKGKQTLSLPVKEPEPSGQGSVPRVGRAERAIVQRDGYRGEDEGRISPVSPHFS